MSQIATSETKWGAQKAPNKCTQGVESVSGYALTSCLFGRRGDLPYGTIVNETCSPTVTRRGGDHKRHVRKQEARHSQISGPPSIFFRILFIDNYISGKSDILIIICRQVQNRSN